ncbi:MAG TPA: hybrid sensor histidine kinase/response regulator, partial [Ktedonobacteraceae bacterium]|nr:hybrid sensor histidine kinase/response regulator [Ktedonobacteraceae bacterium]
MDEETNRSSLLIVDDDEALLQALPQVVYLRAPSIQVDTANSAETAFQSIESHDYDVIVSDVRMPGTDGLELLAKVHEFRPETPFILITGHGDQDLAIQALRGGAYDYILKPIDRDTFIASVQRAIQTHQLRRQVIQQQLALELHALTQERLVEKRTTELAAANALKDKFLTIVAHELRAPLSNLRQMAQFMRHQIEQGETNRIARGLADMERSISRTEILTQDLLDTSLIDTNLFTLHRRRIDLVALCRSLLEEYTAGSPHQLRCEHQEEPLEAEVDRDRLSQVLLNLISNAWKYSPEGSPITVSVQQSGYEAVLAVRDTGVGIPEDALPHIFEQFYRAPGVEVQTGTRNGLGLGLYISRKIIERHGGHIE